MRNRSMIYSIFIVISIIIFFIFRFNIRDKKGNPIDKHFIKPINNTLGDALNKVNDIPDFLNKKYEKKFPKNARLKLANYIFDIIFKKEINNDKLLLEIILLRFEINDSSLKDILSYNEFNLIRRKILNKRTKNGIKNYIHDLILIIYEIQDFAKNIDLAIRDLVSTLYNQHITLGYTQFSLELIIAEVFDYLKRKNKNFRFNRKTKRKLYNSNGFKECGKCGEIKPYEKFYTTKNRLRAICKDCTSISKSIRLFKKKLKVFKEMSENKLIECQYCQIGFEKLPALEIHHTDKDIKSTSWRDIQNIAFEKIIKTLLQEKIIILCSNCHLVEQATYYKEYKKLITNNLFLLMSEDVINNLIYKYCRTLNLDYDSNVKRQILTWIKKRIIISKIYNGKCIGCQKTIEDLELPSFEFHHISRDDKEDFKWDNVSQLDLDQIILLLKNENCISLCANCHQLIHATNFFDNIKEILKNVDQSLLSKLRTEFKEIIENINRFNFCYSKNEYVFNSKNWLTKSKLQILMALSNNQEYKVDQFCKLLDFKRTFCYSKLRDLELRKFIKRSEKRIYKFSLTVEGKSLLALYEKYAKELSLLNYF